MSTTILHLPRDKDDHQCTTVGSTKPDNFRLAKTPEGELILQGRFRSECVVCGWTKETWEDVPTVLLPSPAPKPITRREKLSLWFGKLLSGLRS